MNVFQRETTSRGRRRASVLLAVLGASLIVALIGLAAMTAMRIQRRQNQARQSAAQASAYARSAVDIALLKIAEDPAWRDSFTSWTTEFDVGDDKLSFALTDQADGNVSNNAYDRVMLTGKGQIGQVVRLYSVFLDPVSVDGPENLLANGDIENGTLAWSGLGYATVESSSGNQHAGNRCILVSNRYNETGALNQVITSKVENGKTYYSEFWIKMTDSPEDVSLTIAVYNGVTFSNHQQTFAAVGTEWTRLTTVKTLSWSSVPVYILWYVHPTTTTQDFYVDDAILAEGTGPPGDPAEVSVVTGSWMRDVLP